VAILALGALNSLYIEAFRRSFTWSMAALDAVVDERMEKLKEDRCSKQKNRIRLTADPAISVTSLVAILVAFLKYKHTKCLETCVEPPPSGPVSFGWHSPPAPDWLVKTSALLYDLLEVCKNSKVAGVKMRKALEVLYKNHDLELRTNKKHSAEDCMDRLDFMIRVLLNMVRNLKSSPNLKLKVFRSLSRAEQVRLDLVLDRCILPPEMMAGGEIECDYEEEKIQNLDGLPLREELVPLPPPEEPEKMHTTEMKRQGYRCQGNSGLPPMPAVFSQILYGNKAPAPAAPAVSEKAVAKTEHTGNRKAKKPTVDASTMFTNVLRKVADYTPAATLKKPKAAPKKQKEKNKSTKHKKTKKTSQKKKNKEKIKVTETGQGKKKKKQPEKVESGGSKDSTNSEVVETEYKPGEMKEEQKIWVQWYIQKEEKNGNVISKGEANKQWLVSLRRAQILCRVPLSDLKRRRFVPKGADTNPFLAMVEAQLAKDVD